ncbi:TonB-dependent receptor [Galbibacter sp. EGI 63066]|uniref:SusC/RagA family TonB-linked outer membrane protein n=1 Tax=Galbibacter sp. EGI 63066 TaxID=2993559 RepID=UPI00224950BA|nr:TonB-dependent receptor [Galbibacter sp. EGI 63066]MCX2678794.1 TonB-dependent receptor [Galbibacter sp. EGI 63066]
MKTNLFKRFVLPIAFLCFGYTQAQQTVSGTVSDENGPLPGANVLVKGTTNGTQTDFDGNYQLTDVSDDAVLVVTYIGFAAQEISVNGRSTVNVVLQEDAQALDEVVVVGYGTQKKKEITSAVASVKAEDFNQGGVRSPMDLVQGKVAGLNITRTQGNNPNSGASLQLRGVSSVSGDISPLIVIDGIPGGNLDLLQQDDIESIDVLKDGSAAAIYGTRGNAGVILITTKKGRSGVTKTEYNTYIQREFVDKKPNYLSASEFRDLIAQGVISEDQDFGYTTDLYDELLNKSNLSQYHNFSISGGSDKTNYRASAYYNDAEGLPKENGREQFGGRFSINHKGLQDLLTVQSNIAANFNKANFLGGGTGDFEQAIQRNPTAPLYNPDGSFYETQAYNNYNPLSRLANRINERNQETFSGDLRLSLQLAEGLTASVFGSYVRNTYNDRQYRSMNDWDQRPTSQYQGTAYARKLNNLDWSKTLEATLEYKTTIAKDHNIGVIGGYSHQYSTREEFWVDNSGFTTDGFLDWNLGAGSAIQNTQLPRPGLDSFKEDNTLIGVFGRLNYAYKEKYFAQFIIRREGSSRFGDNHKWGNFPAASVGWTISEESFMQGIDAINQLKIRFGYGVTGNQGIGNYQSLVTLGTGGVYPQDGVYYQTYGAARNPNPDLKWEEKHEMNLGIDFGFLNNRLSGAIDLYKRNTKDLLFNYKAQQPPFVRDLIFTNVGELENKGIEVLISGLPVQGEDFQWNVDFTGSYQDNKLKVLSNENFQANWLNFGGLPSPGNLGDAIRLEEGGAVGNFYGKRFAGLTDDGKWLFYKEDGTTGLASEMNENDLTVIGNGVPKYQASLSNSLKYKNFDLTIFFRGKFGFDILNTKDMYFGNKKWLPNNLLKSAITKHNDIDDDPQYSDYYIEKGDFVKLDNITLGYNVPLDSKYIQSLRMYISGRNLATFTGYSGIDPELQDTGFTTGIDGRDFYPRTKSWTFGLNFGF